MKTHLIIGLLTLSSLSFTADNSWTFEKEEYSVKAYTRPKLGEDIREFRTDCEINATISSIVSVLKDSKVSHEWVKDVEKVELIGKMTDKEWDTHTFVDLPWPISNRDITTKSKLTLLASTNQVRIDISSISNKVPVNEDYVRMTNTSGHWLFTRLDSAKTRVEYEMFADPSGAIPSSVINPFIIDGPINNMVELRKIVKRDKYKSASLSYVNYW